MEMKLELVALPVSDTDRAIKFYQQVGFHLDVDQQVNDKLRFVQLTPPGSACSVALGEGIGEDMAAGSVKGLQMVVADAQAAHDELAKRGVEVSAVDVQPWGSFVYFSDPDGNKWALQELPKRG